MSDINQIIAKIAARAATKAAELHVQAEAKWNGVFHVPANIALRFEAKGLEELSSMLTKLVNVVDPVEAVPAVVGAVPVLPFKIVTPGGVPISIGGETAPTIDVVGNNKGEAPIAGAPQTPSQTGDLIEGSAI